MWPRHGTRTAATIAVVNASEEAHVLDLRIEGACPDAAGMGDRGR